MDAPHFRAIYESLGDRKDEHPAWKHAADLEDMMIALLENGESVRVSLEGEETLCLLFPSGRMMHFGKTVFGVNAITVLRRYFPETVQNRIFDQFATNAARALSFCQDGV